MRSKKKKNIIYILISVFILVYAFCSKPLIECGTRDNNIYKKTLIILGVTILLFGIISRLKSRKKKYINIIIIFIGIISSILIYSGHSKDYKIRNENNYKKIFNINDSISNDSVTSVSKESAINTNALDGDLLKVNYIDVGQGDSIFIELPNKETMLIDAGERNYDKKVISYIDTLGYSRLDYVIGTHPHTDHIGGLASVIKKYDVGGIYMPKKESNSKTFVNLLNTIKDKNLKIHTAKAGVSIINNDKLKVDILAPSKEYSDANNNSAVVKITYINRCFLFMGDAEVESEKNITDSVMCDVIKIGHHGSDTSSGISFVKSTNAKYAVVSVGKGNIYKHPYDFILKRWEDSGAEVLRTDELGDIVITTNGNELSINNEKVNYVDDNSDNDVKSKNIEVVNIDTHIGGKSEIKIKGIPNTKYIIKVYYSSGVSKAKGLSEKESDSNGYVTWNFNISPKTKKGKYKFTINDEEFDYEIK